MRTDWPDRTVNPACMKPRGGRHLPAGKAKHTPVFCWSQAGVHIAPAFAVAVRERVNDGVEDLGVAQVQLIQDRERVGVQAGDRFDPDRGGLPRADVLVPAVCLTPAPDRCRPTQDRCLANRGRAKEMQQCAIDAELVKQRPGERRADCDDQVRVSRARGRRPSLASRLACQRVCRATRSRARHTTSFPGVLRAEESHPAGRTRRCSASQCTGRWYSEPRAWLPGCMRGRGLGGGGQVSKPRLSNSPSASSPRPANKRMGIMWRLATPSLVMNSTRRPYSSPRALVFARTSSGAQIRWSVSTVSPLLVTVRPWNHVPAGYHMSPCFHGSW